MFSLDGQAIPNVSWGDKKKYYDIDMINGGNWMEIPSTKHVRRMYFDVLCGVVVLLPRKTKQNKNTGKVDTWQ